MEWMENEDTAGSHDPEVMIDAFGQDKRARVERFYRDFYDAKKRMKSHFPQTIEELKPDKRAEVRVRSSSS